jgi:hydroxyethylthiazole kinase-like uncharacterized protein yjeF
MRRLLPLANSLPVFSVATSRRIEAAGPPGLMERAGLAVAKLALAIRRGAGPVWVACGPGNNGGDGLVAARQLHALGIPVAIQLFADPARFPPDAAVAWWQAQDLPLCTTPPAAPSLVIDAVLGLGLNRAPSQELAAAIDTINTMDAPVLAIDLPSGLLADTGQPASPHIVRATHTLVLLTLKPGLLTAAGRDFCGTLWFDDLGVGPELPPDAFALGADSLLTPSRAASSHKGSHGEVLVVGGAAGLQGAARLAGRAALACGAGRVYLETLDGAHDSADPQTPELMRWNHRQPELADCVGVVGCGGGAAIASRLPECLREMPRLVLDADALNAIAGQADLQAALLARAGLRPTLLTPHPLEAARLLGQSAADVQRDRLAAAAALAARFGCTVVLKGSGSVVATPGETPALNTSGGPALATAGTGDVLAGWLGGLWAQAPAEGAHRIARAGVHAHGLAGPGDAPLRAGQLIERLAALAHR